MKKQEKEKIIVQVKEPVKQTPKEIKTTKNNDGGYIWIV
jgi:hypothetical protein